MAVYISHTASIGLDEQMEMPQFKEGAWSYPRMQVSSCSTRSSMSIALYIDKQSSNILMIMTQIRLRDVVIMASHQQTGTYVDVNTRWRRDLAINGGDNQLAWIASLEGEQWDDPDSHTPYVSYMHVCMLILGPHGILIYTVYELACRHWSLCWKENAYALSGTTRQATLHPKEL